MSTVEIVDLTTICQSFPEIASSTDNNTNKSSDILIPRDNFIDLIDTIFDGGHELVGVEGEEGVGKTILLAQYAQKHPNNSISLFIRSASKLGYDPLTIQYDLCNQIEWVLKRERILDPEDANEAYLRKLFIRLQQYAKCRNLIFYFVIDGIDEIPRECQYIKEFIFDILPFGLSNYRFLITGDPQKFPPSLINNIKYKAVSLTSFTFDETARFFSPFNISRDLIEEIYKNFKKPGHLAAVKRILQTGMNVDDFINDIPSKLPELFEIEWKGVAIDKTQELMLSIVAFDKTSHTVIGISELLDISIENVLQNLRDLNFITINNEDSTISFVSDSFKKYAMEKLASNKDSVYDLLIDHLVKRPQSEEALLKLPDYYAQKGRYSELIEYLCPDNLTEVMNRCQSMSILKQKIDIGIINSYSKKELVDLIRLSTQKSIVNEISNSEIWRSEIEARLSMNDYDAALALAHNSVLKEDRLHSLAVIAKKKKEQGFIPETEINEQIRQLYKQIDYSTLGEKAIEIASDLIYSNPDIAIELVEKSANSQIGENTLDWAYTQLTLSALSKNSELQINEHLDAMTQKINNLSIKGLNSGIRLLIRDHSANEVIFEVEKLDSVSNRLFLLREWLYLNQHRDDAVVVVEYAIKQIVKSSDYTPNARIFRELIIPFPHIKDISTLKTLIGMIDSQQCNIENLGPTEDYVRLQLLISEAEIKMSIDVVSNRLVDLYFYICNISDLAVKSGCIAWLVTFIINVDPEMKLEKKDGIFSLSESELNTSIEILLNSTADHYNVTKRVITALARTKINDALKIAEMLNTEQRRDLAFFEIIKSALISNSTHLDFNAIFKVFEKISLNPLKDNAYFIIIDWLGDSDIDLTKYIPQLLPIIRYYSLVEDNRRKCIACCTLFSICKKNNIFDLGYRDLGDDILNHLNRAWNLMDVGSDKIDIGFKITEILIPYVPEKAKQILSETERLKEKSPISTSSSEANILYCINLAIRAFFGLLTNKIERLDDLEHITDLINRLPSSRTRIEMWSEVATRYYLAKRKDEFRNIIHNHIIPILDDMKNGDIKCYHSTLCNIFHILYQNHSLTAHDQIQILPNALRDLAYINAAKFILRKCPPSDPYEEFSGIWYNIDYEDIVDLCDIANKMQNDSFIYSIISSICESVSARKVFFNSQQRADICSKLKSIIMAKLPNKRFIQHDGYKIASLAQVVHLEKGQEATWEKLISDAKNIPNLADQAYVLCVIAVLMPRSNRQRVIIKDARDLVEKIPSAYDKAERYETLGQLTWDTEKNTSKECFINAMKFAMQNDHKENDTMQRNIIDHAFRLDPELASSLASLLDSNKPHNISSPNKLKQRIELLKLRKGIEEEIEDKSKGIDRKESINYSEVAWMMLGSLNSGRLSVLSTSYSFKYLLKASELQISESYPIYAWVIENTVKKLSNLNHISSLLRPIFDSMILSVDLAYRLTYCSFNIKNKNFKNSIPKSCHNSKVVKPGERENAISYIAKWLKDNLRDYIKICDPFFSLKDLELLQLIQSTDIGCNVTILTSVKVQDNMKILKPWEDSYLDYWRHHLSDQNPPSTDIIIVGTERSGELPIHDRWIITNGSGIRMGTSFNSLGINKYSEMSVLSADEAEKTEYIIDQYITHKKKDHNGEKLKYTHFNF